MKTAACLVLCAILSACGGYDNRDCYISGEDCDGSAVGGREPGPTGPQGPAGVSGQNGRDGNDGLDGSRGRTGATGATGEAGPAGPQGETGAQGDEGPQGPQGLDGLPGEPGEISDFSPVNIIDPCGDSPGIFDELILVLGDGSLLATVSDNSNGTNTRLALLPAGAWQTSDGSECVFTVTPEGEITW